MAKNQTVTTDQGKCYNVNSDGSLSEKSSNGLLGALADNLAANISAVTGGSRKK